MGNLVELSSIQTPDEAIVLSARTALAEVEAVRVVTATDYSALAATVQAIKSRWVAIDDERKKLKEPIDRAAKAVQDFFRAPLDSLKTAENVGKSKLAIYAQAQERIRREEQAKADEAARRERERLEARAAKAAEAGREEKAGALQESAAAVVAPVITRAPPKVSGLSTRSVWKFEITDPSKVSAAFLMPDESKIRAVVQSLKADAQSLVGDGVRIYEDVQIAARSA